MTTMADNAMAKARALERQLGGTPATLLTIKAMIRALQAEIDALQAEVDALISGGGGGGGGTDTDVVYCTSYVLDAPPTTANVGDFWSQP